MRELPALIVVAFGLALLMKTFLIQAFFIPSESMEPTLHGCNGCNGDRVLVNKFAYRFREPRRGEIIVFIAKKDLEQKTLLKKIRDVLFGGLGVTTPRETDFIKRIIGLPGDTIQVTDRALYITPPHGKRTRLTEPYIRLPEGINRSLQAPLVVKPGMLFVMGDNRNNSSDSRVIGPIQRRDVIGKAFVRIWPVGRIGILHVPSYPAALAMGGWPLAAFVLAAHRRYPRAHCALRVEARRRR